MSRMCEQQTVGGTPMKIVVILVVLQKKQHYTRKWQMRHLGHSPPKAIDNHTLRNTKFALLWNEQYSRDAAIEDGIALKLEQLYGRQKRFTDKFLIYKN